MNTSAELRKHTHTAYIHTRLHTCIHSIYTWVHTHTQGEEDVFPPQEARRMDRSFKCLPSLNSRSLASLGRCVCIRVCVYVCVFVCIRVCVCICVCEFGPIVGGCGCV